MKTRLTRQGTLHYLECTDCGIEKTTRFQRAKPLCKPCGHKHRRVENRDVNGLRECRVCRENKPATTEHYHYHTKATGKLKGTCKPCDQARRSQWNKDNPERHNSHTRKTFAKNYSRWKQNPAWVMKQRVGSAVANFLSKQTIPGYKQRPTFDALPYTPEQLVEHLEKQFDDKMTWDNYGTYWHVDHIYPQSKLPFDSLDHINFLTCWALTNLRPLEASANMSKGAKVIDDLVEGHKE